jgi:hypothetical protein
MEVYAGKGELSGELDIGQRAQDDRIDAEQQADYFHVQCAINIVMLGSDSPSKPFSNTFNELLYRLSNFIRLLDWNQMSRALYNKQACLAA